MVRQPAAHHQRSSREVFSFEAENGGHSAHNLSDSGRLPPIPENRVSPPRLIIPPPPPSNLLRKISGGFRPISNYWEADRSSPIIESPKQLSVAPTSPIKDHSATLPRLSLIATRPSAPFPISESTTKFEAVAERSDRSLAQNPVKSLDALLNSKSSNRANTSMSFEDLHKVVGAEALFVGGRPLVTKRRKLIRNDAILAESTGSAVNRHFLLFNDVLISGCPQDSSSKKPGPCAPLNKQTLAPLKNINLEAIEGLPHLHITAARENYKLHFTDLSARDQWHASVTSAIAALELSSSRGNRNRSQQYESKRYSATVNDPFIRSWTAPLANSNIMNEFKDANYSLYEAMQYLGGIKVGIGSLRGSFRESQGNSVQNGVTWVPDTEAEACMVCKATKFSVLIRRHHCRSCGRVICYKCSVLYETSSPPNECLMRICKECTVKMRRDLNEEWD